MEAQGSQPPELLELLATDLDRYFHHLVLSFQHRLYSFALRQTGSHQDAEDIAQEAFIRAYHALADYPPERIRAMKLQSWLYKITLHIFYRHASSVRLVCDPLDLSEESEMLEIEVDEQALPENILEGQENLRELEETIARLPEQYRIVVSCYYFDELNYRELADMLNQPIGTVKSNVHRGTLLLRKMLKEQSHDHAGNAV